MTIFPYPASARAQESASAGQREQVADPKIANPQAKPSGQGAGEGVSAKLVLSDLGSVNYLNLPRLPLPSLDQSIEDLLASCRVLDAGDRYVALAEKAEDFLKGIGPRLQSALEVQNGGQAYPFHFVQEVWDEQYLQNRAPHPISTSPFFQLSQDKVCGTAQAAQFVRAVVQWTKNLRAGELNVDNGLCPSAMAKLFSTAKVPRPGHDEIVCSDHADNIILVCGGNFFSLPVIVDGDVAPAALIEQAIARALTYPQSTHSIGTFTSAPRDEWALSRQQLIIDDSRHTQLLETIDKAIVVLCIDTETRGAHEHSETAENLASRFLMGDAANRWFDKHQIILHQPSGRVALNFEHTCSDGTNWIQFIQECVADMALETSPSEAAPSEAGSVNDLAVQQMRSLGFVLSERIKTQIESQQKAWRTQTDTVDLSVMEYAKWGKNFAKSQSVSPDALIQMAFQLAYFRLEGKLAPTYESAHMRRFFCGRTDTIRACTAAARDFVADWQSGVGSLKTLLVATDAHSAQSKKVAAGFGIDRHLLCLEQSAQAQGEQVSLFEDPLYRESSTWALSTSNASDPNLAVFGFGAVTASGFGLGYLIQPDSVTVTVSAFKPEDLSLANRAARFAACLSQVLDDIADGFKTGDKSLTSNIFP